MKHEQKTNNILLGVWSYTWLDYLFKKNKRINSLVYDDFAYSSCVGWSPTF